MSKRTRSKRWLGHPEASAPALSAQPDPQGRPEPLERIRSLSAAKNEESTAVGRHWEQVSAGWRVHDAPQLAPLVVPTGNADAPIHRWFHLKEAYSKDLLREVLVLLPEVIAPDGGLTIVDPFTGVGTTLLSAVDLLREGKFGRLVGYGLEINPFLRSVAATKLRSSLAPSRPDLNRLAALVSEARSVDVSWGDCPALSTFANSRFFPPEHVEQLVRLRRTIDNAGLDDAHRDWARLALAMTVEPASRLRRDGRALRYEDRSPLPPNEVFVRALHRIAEDVPANIEALPADVRIVHSTAVATKWDSVPTGSADLVLFSPPYPNNIDYTEVYKTELWALAFVDNHGAFLEQRHATLRSHPSVKFRREVAFTAGPRSGDVEKLLNPLLAAIPSPSRYAKPLARMIEGYADDMLRTFDAAYQSLRAGGYCVYVVGNSVHGTAEQPVIIASDVMLARLAEAAGFTVGTIHIARTLPRRRIKSNFVRESLVVLRKEH